MKYIRFKHRGFVLFGETQSHKEFANLIQDEVVSAGFARACDYIEQGKPT